MTDKLPPNSAVVMLIKRDDGGFDVVDQDRNTTMVGTPDQLWSRAHELVGGGTTALAVREPRGPGGTMRWARKRATQRVHAPSNSDAGPSEDDIADAFRVVGSYVRDVASEEYGAPVVNAASTLIGAAASKGTKVAKRLSRGNRPRAKYRNRRK